jgi:hypothetical protein
VKSVSDLEDQVSEDQKRANKRENERAAALEKKYAENLREQKEDDDRTLMNAKDSYHESFSNERENHKAELDRMKRESTYDKFGRMALENEQAAKLREVQANADLTSRQAEDRLKTAENNFNRRLFDRDRAQRDDAAKQLDSLRDTENTHHEEAINYQKEAFANLRDDSAKKVENLNHDHLMELQEQRTKAERAINDSHLESDRRVDQAKKAYEKSTDRQDRAMLESQSATAARLRDSHREETDELRAQVAKIQQHEKLYGKSKAEGTADAERNYNDEWNTRLQATQGSSDREIQNLKSQNRVTENRLGAMNSENMRDRDLKFANELHRVNEDNHLQTTQLTEGFTRSQKQMVESANREKASAQMAYEKRMGEEMERSQSSMQNQAKTFNDSLSRQKQSDSEQIKSLQSALTEQKNTADVAAISPAAEANLRKQVTEQYQKAAETDQMRNRDATERVRSNYQDALEKETDLRKSQQTTFSRTTAATENDQRKRFLTAAAEAEYVKNSSLQAQETDHQRQTENLNKSYNRQLQRQGAERDEMYNVSREEAANRMAAQKQDFDYQQRVAQHEYSVHTNELIHDYNKKLVEQKTDYEAKLADQKTASDNQLREAERKAKTMFDNQAREYEQKIAQQELQNQERQRFIAQNYQDEIDKLRRSSEMMARKKT